MELEEVLDNPIWNALNAGNRQLASGDDRAKFVNRQAGAFAGLRDNSIADLMSLYEQTQPEEVMVLFVPREITVPREWRVEFKKPLLQMIYRSKQSPSSSAQAIQLTHQHVPAMLSLTALTEPGPFLPGTIDFGNYQGVYDGEQLVAMAGQRLKPDPYTEISAICTHPDHLGKGYASLLIGNQIHHILSNSGIPFLHVLPENTTAFRLYLKLGFEVRKEILCYVLKKPGERI